MSKGLKPGDLHVHQHSGKFFGNLFLRFLNRFVKSFLEIVTRFPVDGNLFNLLVASDFDHDVTLGNFDHNLLHFGFQLLALLAKIIQLFHLFKHRFLDGRTPLTYQFRYAQLYYS